VVEEKEEEEEAEEEQEEEEEEAAYPDMTIDCGAAVEIRLSYAFCETSYRCGDFFSVGSLARETRRKKEKTRQKIRVNRKK
jgi:hypothetical protein